MKKNKLGVTYSLFSGEELLRASILSIRNNVDYINVVWQEFSWTGKKANPEVEALLNSLKSEGLIDNVIKFEFNQTKDEKKNSRIMNKKLNMGIRDLKKAGCTHMMLMDVDEFYYEDEFKKAKQYVYDHNITHSACAIYDYHYLPYYRTRDARDYSVSFIFKINMFSWVIARNSMPCLVDTHRTVAYIPFIHKFYYLNMVSMRHMTGIRKDYKLKLSSTETNLSEGGEKVIQKYGKLHDELSSMSEKEILEQGFIKVDDEFGVLNQ